MYTATKVENVMVENGQSEFLNSCDRRQLLKKSVGSLSGIAILSNLSTTVSAQEDDFDPEFTVDAVFDERFSIAPLDKELNLTQASETHRVDSAKIGSKAIHQFVTSFCTTTDELRHGSEWEKIELLKGVDLTIDNRHPNNSSIVSPAEDDERMIAVTQNSGSEYNWGKGIESAAMAVAGLASTYAAIPVGAASVVAALTNDGEEIEGGNEEEYSWEFKTWYGSWVMQDYVGGSVRFYIEADSPEDGYSVSVETESYPGNGWSRGYDVPPDPWTRTGLAADFDVTSSVTRYTVNSTVSVDEIDDPVYKRYAQEEGVKRISKLSYPNESDRVHSELSESN